MKLSTCCYFLAFVSVAQAASYFDASVNTPAPTEEVSPSLNPDDYVRERLPDAQLLPGASTIGGVLVNLLPLPQASASDMPSMTPSDAPSMAPSDMPSLAPSDAPSMSPSMTPSSVATPKDRVYPYDVYTAPNTDSDMPSDVPSNMPSDLPSDMPSLAPSSMPTSFGYGKPGLFKEYCSKVVVGGTTVPVDFTYRLRVNNNLVKDSASALDPILKNFETAMQGAVVDVLCSDSAVVSIDSQPADIPIDTCGQSCFNILGQMLIQVKDTDRIDEIRCTAMETLYSLLESPTLESKDNVRSYQWGSDVNNRCLTIPSGVHDDAPQESDASSSTGGIMAITAFSVAGAFVVLSAMIVGRHLYRSRNETTQDDISLITTSFEDAPGPVTRNSSWGASAATTRKYCETTGVTMINHAGTPMMIQNDVEALEEGLEDVQLTPSRNPTMHDGASSPRIIEHGTLRTPKAEDWEAQCLS